MRPRGRWIFGDTLIAAIMPNKNQVGFRYSQVKSITPTDQVSREIIQRLLTGPDICNDRINKLKKSARKIESPMIPCSTITEIKLLWATKATTSAGPLEFALG